MSVFRSWNIPVVGGAPVGASGSYAWIKSLGTVLGLDSALVNQVAEAEREQAQAILSAMPLSGRIFVTGYEGTELAYARLLVEAGAEVPYVSTSIGPDPLVLPDESWLRARGTKEVIYRKSLEDDVAALDKYPPDLVFGTTPFCAVAKERGIPAMYFTNQLASRPFFLSGGMAATLAFIRQTLEGSTRYEWMQEFFAELPSA
jgi:chlorophyllide a reductase subunit Y